MVDQTMTEKYEGGPGLLARLMRLAHGLTLQNLAARTGISPSTLSRFENGSLAVSFEAVKTIFEALGGSLSVYISVYIPKQGQGDDKVSSANRVVNLDLLQKQKSSLLSLRRRQEKNLDLYTDLSGIIHLLDELGDDLQANGFAHLVARADASSPQQ